MPTLIDIVQILAINFGLCLASFVLLWGLGVLIRDVTFIDAWWALGLASMGVATYFQADGSSQRMGLILALVCIWGLRLGSYMLWRWRDHGPDRRYVKMMERAGQKGISFPKAAWVMVFQLQAPLLFVVSLPVQIGQMSPTPVAVGLVGMIGAGLAVFGILFESLADWQMVRFKKNPANQGQVMDRGLWRYTQHPNYFGDLCVWFGLWLIAAETGLLGILSIVGPILLVVLFIRYSGGVSYEKRLKHTRPGYADYMARTSPMIPWPPKKGDNL
jgi:steroid 5-alpha reductase family enzyme